MRLKPRWKGLAGFRLADQGAHLLVDLRRGRRRSARPKRVCSKGNIAGLPLFETMAQARARKNPLSVKMWPKVAMNLPARDRPPTIQEILLAVAACGWLPKGGDRLTIRFKEGVPAKSYEWDLVRKNILAALVKLRERPRDYQKKNNRRRGARPNPKASSPDTLPSQSPELDKKEEKQAENRKDDDPTP